MLYTLGVGGGVLSFHTIFFVCGFVKAGSRLRKGVEKCMPVQSSVSVNWKAVFEEWPVYLMVWVC